MTEPSTFARLCARLDHAMFIVTAREGAQRDGCLVGFATQCSIDPPRFLACLSVRNRTWRLARASDAVLVHAVPADAPDLARLFGGQTGDEVDKLARCAWRDRPGGLPLLDRATSWFAGRILERIPLGDHVGVLLEPFAVNDGGELALSSRRLGHVEPGHAP